MKNEEIHRGFSQSEIRDFLSQELRDARMEGGVGISSVKYIEEQVEKYQKLLKCAKKFQSLKQIIEDKNWGEWDIEDVISYNRETYFSFIGTEEEYYKLMKALKEEYTK